MGLSILFSLITFLCTPPSVLMSTVLSQQISFDDTFGVGRTFHGIGGLSGGGATSKLLVNYPAKQRDIILDYLFKPNVGAALQILKVEIGGDAQSTDGSEASHMHDPWDENYERGYEWWLMKEAKQRNPNIKLYGLPWAFPGWVGQGTRSPYTNINATAYYVVNWINGAKQFHNLTIDYVGIWNERMYNREYIKTLRAVLNKRGFENTKIVAADLKWEIADDIIKYPELAPDIYAIGCHYPGTNSTVEAEFTNKPLWASEDYSTFNDEIGGGCWARILNQNYVNGKMTATIAWNLIASYYKGLPYFRDGLMTAIEPWSGHFVLETPIWITAHTTHFTNIGWEYLAHGRGAGKLPKGGSYVAFAPPTKTDLTIVIETMTHNHSVCIRPSLPAYSVSPQVITIALKGSFLNISELNVWYSKYGYNGTNSTMFEYTGKLKLSNGSAELSLGIDEVYTLTTVDSQKQPLPVPPPSSEFPLPYFDDFENYQDNEEPFYLAQQIGSYEILGSVENFFLRQMVLDTPVYWCGADNINKSLNIIGSSNWTDVLLKIDFRMPEEIGTPGIFVAARVDSGGCLSATAHGIFLFIFSNKFILANDLARATEITSGPLSINTASWHTVELKIGESVHGFLNGELLFTTDIPDEPKSGFCAIGTDTFGLADFDNLYIDQTAPRASGLKRQSKQTFEKASNSLYFESEST